MSSRIKISDAKILIVGVTRNCEKIIESEVLKIDSAFGDFKEKQWLIVESDSDDGTLHALDLLKNKVNLRVISLGRLRGEIPNRSYRLAFCRNHYLQVINTDDAYKALDFVVIADLDGVNQAIGKDAVISCWNSDVDWDACFANQNGPYYDIWALRHPSWSPNDCWTNYHFLRAHNVAENVALLSAVYSRMISIDSNRPPIRVESAFGGLGIYKRSLFLNASYQGADAYGKEVCEHVTLHKAMTSNGAKLFIIPSFINGGWNEHSERLVTTPLTG